MPPMANTPETEMRRSFRSGLDWELEELHPCNKHLPKRLDYLDKEGKYYCTGIYSGYRYNTDNILRLKAKKILGVIFEYQHADPLVIQQQLYDIIGADLALRPELRSICKSLAYKGTKPTKFVPNSEKFYCVYPEFKCGILDWMAEERAAFLKSVKCGKASFGDWYSGQRKTNILTLAKFLLLFLYKKRDFIHGNLPYGIAVNKVLDKEGKKVLIDGVRACNATGLSTSLPDIDVVDVKNLIYMLFLCGNPEAFKNFRSSTDYKESITGSKPYFTSKNSTKEIKCFFDTLIQIPHEYDEKFDYKFWCAMNILFWDPLQKKEYIINMHELFHVALQEHLCWIIQILVSWPDGGHFRPYQFQGKCNCGLYTKVYNYIPPGGYVYSKPPYTKGQSMKFGRDSIHHGNEDYKKGIVEEYKEPELLAEEIFLDFTFPMAFFIAVGKMASLSCPCGYWEEKFEDDLAKYRPELRKRLCALGLVD